jgi:hypothetical protein
MVLGFGNGVKLDFMVEEGWTALRTKQDECW